MNKYIIGTAVLLILLLSIGNVSAVMYEASIDTFKSEVNDTGVITDWILKDDNLWIGQSEYHEVFGGIKIEFEQPAYDLSYGSFTVNKEGKTEWIDPYTSGENNFAIIEDFEIKIVLNDIREQSGTSSNIVYPGETVVKMWVSPNSKDELGLTYDGVNTYNPIEYGTTNGWSSTGSTSDVTLNIERIKDGPILVKIDGGEYEENECNNNNKRIFKLKENAEYTITIEYVLIDDWEGESDETEIYKLTISGLESSSSSSVSSSGLLGAYSKEAGNKISVVTSCDGTFTEMSGLTVTPSGQNADGNYVWDLTFDSAGTKRIDFVSNSGGEGYFDFQISAKQDTSESKVTEKDDGEDNNLGLILIVLGLVGAVVLILFNKKGKNKKGSVGMTPENAI